MIRSVLIRLAYKVYVKLKSPMVLSQSHELIIKFLENTDKPIFLTGKAGTGKTTFLHYLRTNLKKNIAVVAPTAVAAINAGGVTLHSFFQIPFGPLIPPPNNDTIKDQVPLKQINHEKAKLLRSLNLLIVDEISMVRADTLDYINVVLQQTRGSLRPFGGVQILMIGDPYQLPPVYQNDWPILSKFYKSPYFFDGIIFGKSPFLTFELTEVYRQKDPVFIDILNNIRSGNTDKAILEKLNEQYRPQINVEELGDYVTLSTHNKLVNDTNQLRLKELRAEAHTFSAVISGEFPHEAYPAEEELVLKEGAFVMFIKNDTSGKKQYYNGRTGRVSAIDGMRIRINFLDDGSEFVASPEIWQNVKYSLSETESKIKESTTGSFTQFPLRLAWAITIHKSQGLTFEKAVLDVNAAFAHGQTYVALSRCRSLEGVILKNPVKPENIFSDPLIVRFMQNVLNQKRGVDTLAQEILHSENQTLLDLFDFSILNGSWNSFRIVLTSDTRFQNNLLTIADKVNNILAHEITSVANKFIRQDLSVLLDNKMIWQSSTVMNRLKKAAEYFFLRLEELVGTINKLFLELETTDVSPDFYPSLNHLLLNLHTKKAAFHCLPPACSVNDISNAIMQAGISYQTVSPRIKMQKPPKEVKIKNPKLYDSLIQWRTRIAAQRQVQEYILVSDTVLKEISTKLPRSLSQLSQVKNFGEVKAGDFGTDLIKLVGDYLGENELFI